MELDIYFSNSTVNAILKNAPICCPDGWRLVYTGSRFTTPTEAGFSPTEGESLAVAWALDNARMFVHG